MDCQIAVDSYVGNLSKINNPKVEFYPRYLEEFIQTLRQINNCKWTKELEDRYLGASQ